MVWFWYLGVSYQAYVVDKNHTDVHLNFCSYFEVFQSTFVEILNCEATVLTIVSRLPQETANKQECLQINKTTQCFGTVNLKGKREKFLSRNWFTGYLYSQFSPGSPIFKNGKILMMCQLCECLWHKQMYIYI